MKLKKGQNTGGPGDFNMYRDIYHEITLEEVTGDIGFLNNNNDHMF